MEKQETKTIPEAYCVELGEVIDITTAHDEYFRQPAHKRKELTFLCPDETCRAKYSPKISGVNYTKEIYKLTPHFRRFPNDEHWDECMLRKHDSAMSEILKNKQLFARNSKRNLFLDFDGSEEIVDIFVTPEDLQKANDTRKARHMNTAEQPERQPRQKDIYDHIAKSYLRSSSLEIVVKSFEKLSKMERKIAELTIDGYRMSYSNAFKHVRYFEQSRSTRHIYYGEASIYRYKEGYRVFYKGKTTHYNDTFPQLGITLFYPHSELEKPRAYSLLKNLEKIHTSANKKCCFYSFSTGELQKISITQKDGSEALMDFIVLDSEFLFLSIASLEREKCF